MVCNISVIILTKNSERYLIKCLDALEKFDEIIVLDNGSTDQTLNFAKMYSNVKIVEHPFIGFGPLKNIGITHCSHDWILSIDSDEVLTIDLFEEIQNLRPSSHTIYQILRKNHYNGKLIESCGWGNDWVMRLFNKHTSCFNNQAVHESLILNENIKIQKLKYPILHYPFNNAEQLIDKMQKYSSLYAKDWKGKKISSPTKAFIRALFTFIKNYIFQKGFLDGYEGFLISVSNANGTFYKYIKLYEDTINDM